MPQIRLLLMFALGMFMAVSIPVAAQAQDDDSDTDDEAGSEVDQPTTEEDERSSSSDSRRSARSEDDERDAEDILTEDDRRRRRIIKVVQKKHFLKMNRLEVTPQFALMPSDFFLRRYIFGANIAFHISEIFSAEVLGGYSPNLGEADRKALFDFLLARASVQADISRILAIFQLNMGMSPIYGKVELGNNRIVNYDIYMLFGGGVVYTSDDDEVADICLEERADEEDAKYCKQWHPASNFGVGFRIAFNEWLGVRLEGRWTFHVEEVILDELALELKNNFSLHIGASFFLPPEIQKDFE